MQKIYQKIFLGKYETHPKSVRMRANEGECLLNHFWIFSSSTCPEPCERVPPFVKQSNQLVSKSHAFEQDFRLCWKLHFLMDGCFSKAHQIRNGDVIFKRITLIKSI